MNKPKRIGLKPTKEELRMDAQMVVNRKLRRKNTELARQMRVAESVIEKQEMQFDVMSGLVDPRPYDKKKRKIISADFRRKNEATVFSLLSDIHADEKIDPETVNWWNIYNPDIAETRLNTFREGLLKTVRELRKTIAIPHLVLGMLGDFISGYIHEELMENNILSPTEGITFIQSILIDIIRSLSEDGDFKSITIPMIRGNHGRTSQKIKHSTDYKNSYEYMMYLAIRQVFENQLVGYDNVTFIIPKSSFAEITVYGKKISFSHGNEFRYLGGIGGLEIPLRRWGYKMQKAAPADKRYLGHHHTWMPGGKEVVNGSGIGYSKYAMDKAFEPELPQMHFELLDRNREAFTIKLPIILDSFYKR